MKKIAIILGILILIVLISGCTNSEKYKSFNGTKMSFQYPSDWTAKDYSNTAALTKGNDEITIEIINITVDDETGSMITDGYTPRGNFKNNASGTTYKAFEINKGTTVVFLFEKNGKVYEISGPSLYSDVMDKVVETIK